MTMSVATYCVPEGGGDIFPRRTRRLLHATIMLYLKDLEPGWAGTCTELGLRLALRPAVLEVALPARVDRA